MPPRERRALSLLNMIRTLKSQLFQYFRQNFLVSHYKDLKNYLQNVEVKKGIDSIVGKRILVLCPHPDDEAIGCGGTIKLLTTKNTQVDVLYLTDGENALGKDSSDTQKEEMVKTREQESLLSQAILGFKRIYRLHSEDGSLHRSTDLAPELKKFFSMHLYDVVFCPWEFDGHSDHIAAFKELKKMLVELSWEPELWFYETWSPLLANHTVAIDETFKIKIQAIQAYKSQTALVDYATKAEGLAKYRSLLTPENEYAEAFFVTRKETLLKT